ncbi:MAG: DUF1902 domain-containing protein [Chromatiales bacterium]
MSKTVTVNAFFDHDARVWVASSDDVPGLVTEAHTIEALSEKLKVMIPELLDANGLGDGDDIPFHLLSELTAVAPRRTAG